MSAFTIGIDLGGTKIEIVALVRGDDKLLYQQRIATPRGNYEGTLQAIVKLIRHAEAHLGLEAQSIGLGIPGAISLQTGLVKNANSTWLIGKPLQRDLEKRLGRKVKISNDANCMTVSEAVDGAARTANVVFGVIIGTGTGGGIAVNRQVLPGHNLICGEWGHTPLPWRNKQDGLPMDCYCGKQDCIETFLSGPGLVKRFQKRGGKAETVEQLLQQVEKSELARQSMMLYYSQMARALAMVINILDPDCIVLAGGLSNIQSIYKEVPKLWRQFVFSDMVNTPLKPAYHGDASGVRGAAWL